MGPGHQSFSRKADSAIRERSLIARFDTVVVAVSGGVDSVALLDYLVSRSDLSLTLVIAHLNHALRGEESDGDEGFVRHLAERYGIRFECRRTEVSLLAREKGISIEEAGREARYSFFAEVAQAVGADAVAIAHHLDDQAETVLLRLIRGSGPTGLRGMPYRSADGRYIRPFLDLTRMEIEDYAAVRKLPFRTDSSNSDSSFLRNSIRNRLLPYLCEYNPAIARRLADTASIMAADEALLSMTVERRWQEVGQFVEKEAVLDVASVTKDIAGMRLRLYRHSLEMLNGNLRRISYRHLRDIDRLLLEGPPNGTLDLPDSLKVIRSYDKMKFRRCLNVVAETVHETKIPSAGVFELSTGWKVCVELCSGSVPSVENDSMELLVNLAEFPFPWVVRGYSPGDRIVQRGMAGHKKVKDLFIDEKIPRPKRPNIPLFFSGDVLFWVAGLRRGGSSCQYCPDAQKVKVKLLEFVQDTAMIP